MTTDNMSMARRQMLVGRASKMHKEGKTINEIRKALNLSESSVRSIMRVVEEIEKKSSKMKRHV